MSDDITRRISRWKVKADPDKVAALLRELKDDMTRRQEFEQARLYLVLRAVAAAGGGRAAGEVGWADPGPGHPRAHPRRGVQRGRALAVGVGRSAALCASRRTG
jgi:hypothetical protein